MNQLTLFPEAEAETATRPKSKSKPKPEPMPLALPGINSHLLHDLAEAQKGGAQIILWDEPEPDFDSSDKRYFTPGADEYIEAERLPRSWLPLVGKAFWATRIVVGSLADVLEELSPETAEEWRTMFQATVDATTRDELDKADARLDEWQEVHGIGYYGEGFYLADEDERAEWARTREATA